MANSVKIAGANASNNTGGAPKFEGRAGAAPRASQNHGQDAIQSLNQNYAKNPNNARPAATAKDAVESPHARANGKYNATAPPARREFDDESKPPSRGAQKHGRLIGEDGALADQPHRGENGESQASEQGLRHGRGHQKRETVSIETPPIIVPPNDDAEPTGKTRNTPPIIVLPNERANGKHEGRQNLPPLPIPRGSDTPNGQTHRFPTLGVQYSVELNLREHGNQPFGVIRQVVSQVLRQNDIYLSQNALKGLINPQTLHNGARSGFSPEVNNFVQNIGRQVLNLLNTAAPNSRLIHDISRQIVHDHREQIQNSAQTILKNVDLGAIHFRHLNARERLQVAIELLPPHLPPAALESLQQRRPQEILNGLMLARGFVAANEQPADVRNLVTSKLTVLPAEISITALRDVGQIVRMLIADTAAAKSTANLDLAVQKFVKVLLANNELGVLLATINLAGQARGQGGLISSSLALAQIYELINRLIQAGEKTLQNAASENNISNRNRNIFESNGVSLVDETEDAQNLINKKQLLEAAGGLRQFLEFNPALTHDRAVSVFINPDDSRQARQDFVHLCHDDIEAWLKSGNHRLVKDFDFDKPVGVVVERGSDDLFNATTARFVLVRDGSVQGWHFLKSFLVK